MHLHEHEDTHLWDKSFPALAAEQIDPCNDRVLILVENEDEADQLHAQIASELGTPLPHCEVYTGSQETLNLDVDSFDVTVQVNPSRSPFKRHQPLYQATAVTRCGGTIVYKAPRSLAHSDGVNIDTIYALGWENHETPSLGALMTVSIEGTLGKTKPSSTASTPESDRTEHPKTTETTIASFA